MRRIILWYRCYYPLPPSSLPARHSQRARPAALCFRLVSHCPSKRQCCRSDGPLHRGPREPGPPQHYHPQRRGPRRQPPGAACRGPLLGAAPSRADSTRLCRGRRPSVPHLHKARMYIHTRTWSDVAFLSLMLWLPGPISAQAATSKPRGRHWPSPLPGFYSLQLPPPQFPPSLRRPPRVRLPPRCPNLQIRRCP